MKNAIVIAFALLSGCAMLPECADCKAAPRWSERTTAEKWVIGAWTAVGVVALVVIAKEVANGSKADTCVNCGSDEPPPPPLPRCSITGGYTGCMP